MNYLDYHIMLPELNKTEHFMFETIVTDFSNPDRIKKMRYIRKVAITRYKYKGEDMMFQLFLSEIEITSNISVENIFFLKKIESAFDEVELEINDYGRIIRILNLEEIRKRWEMAHAKLAIDNVGVVAESFMLQISNLLKEEQKLIFFFSDYKIFGLYFSSLYRNTYDVKRQRKIIDCGNILITERFCPKDEKFDTYLITGMPVEDVSGTDFIKYNGFIEYRADKIESATLEIEKQKMTILYNVNKTTL